MTSIEVIRTNITQLAVDAIVNAANTSLLGGGGVDGAIHKAGGKQILDECIAIRNRQGGCKVGEAVITSGGNLPAKHVIHTVGPVWKTGHMNEEQLLIGCYTNSLQLALDNNIKTIAFPSISTGAYHFPKDKACVIAITSVRNFLTKHPNKIEKVFFVCFDEENHQIYQSLL